MGSHPAFYNVQGLTVIKSYFLTDGFNRYKVLIVVFITFNPDFLLSLIIIG